MEKTGEIEVEVEAIRLWDTQHQLLGYFAAILGPNDRGTTRTYYLPAIHTPGNANPKVCATSEEAMRAWQEAAPKEMDEALAARLHLPKRAAKEIAARELFREKLP